MSTTLRMPVELRDRMRRIADRETRPLNSQIIHWLREAIDRYERDHPELRESERAEAGER